MESSLLSIARIFSDRLFRIPDYQRGYAWEVKQLSDFWSDLEKIPDGKNHYTGVLTLEGVSKKLYDRWDEDRWIIESKRYNPFFIVDGQQRLTTIIILIQCILESIPENTQINFTDKRDIQKRFIFDSRDSGISRSYIFGYEKDNPSYNFLKRNIFLERSDDNIEDTVYTQNLAQAKDFFRERIKDLDIEKIEKLYINITQNMMFNIFTINSDVDVCIAFETMNNRGKPLSHLELLKNRLIYLSTQLASATSEKEQLRRNINHSWKAIYHNLGRNKNNPLRDDDFLISHCSLYFYENSVSTTSSDEFGIPLFSRGKRKIEDYSTFLLSSVFNQKNISQGRRSGYKISIKFIYDYVTSLKDLVEIWYYIFNPQYSPYSDRLKNILIRLNHIGIGRFISAILLLIHSIKDEEDISSILEELERTIFIQSFTPYRFYTMPDSFFKRNCLDLALKVKNKEISASDAVNMIRKETTELTTNSIFVKELPDSMKWTGGFYNWEIIRYFLYEYEMHLKALTKNQQNKISWDDYKDKESDFVSVEHIYPQHARNPYWTSRFGHYSQRQKEIIRNSLGNLLPLSKKKNSSLSNKPFHEKARGTGKNFVTYEFGSYSEIEVARQQDWTPEAIQERGLKLLEFMETRWRLSIGNLEKKKKFLGIELKNPQSSKK